ncbi:MAG: TolC family protein [Pirellulaceae bacterium]|nr:TolC family protein [Pirellulaceae bacterium]
MNRLTFDREFTQLVCWSVIFLMSFAFLGCRSKPEVKFDGPVSYSPISTEIDYPDTCMTTVSAVEDVAPPRTLREPGPDDYWDLTLKEAIQIALANSEVMRDIGARVLSAPAATPTVFQPALQQTDPRSGEEAALSAFDAQFATSLLFDRDERTYNNPFLAGDLPDPNRAATQHRNTAFFDLEINKVAATGTRMALRHRTDRTSANSTVNLFPSYYDTLFEAEVRQPLLQGSGIAFNRIAGPNSTPGNYNGILIARVRTDIALADFEASVRNFIENVEQTYWLLYFTYRDLDARIAGRDSALEAWRVARVNYEVDEKYADEPLSRAQYYQFQAQVARALSGSGTNSASLTGGPGVYSIERRLRLLMGVEINDGRLIRPAQEPSRAELVFDWGEALNQALQRRVELRRQKWVIRQREMELVAARNFLRMQLDLVGAYRWRGFGDALLGRRADGIDSSAFADLFTGDLQGWQLGLQLSTPIGNRIGHVATRNAELNLRRERAILVEQERQVAKELSDSFADHDRAFKLAQINFNRSISSRQTVEIERIRYEAGESQLQFVLDAESRLADAESQFFGALVEYNLAAAKIHYAKGTYLDYLGVSLAEGAWVAQAYQSAAKESRRYAPRHFDYCVTKPGPVTRGGYQQHILPRTDSEILPLPPVDSQPNDSPTPAELLPPERLPEF